MKLIGINKTYHNKHNDVCVFQNLNLAFPDHGCITIYGESGSGKTTLFQIIAGLDKDYEGVIENNHKIEYLFQEIELFENLSVYDNLLFANLDNEKINHLLEKFDMIELKNQKVKKLSNGEKRRVQIMRSLLNEPDLLLMDEPSASLDQKNAVIVCDMIKQLSKEITVVITTHDEALFDDVADISYRIEHRSLELIKENSLSQLDHDRKGHESVKKKEIDKKNIFQMSALYIKAHKLNMVISIILLFCFSFASYIGFYYNDASGEKQKHNVWNYSTNLIYTFPNDCEIIVQDVIKSVTCYEYDLFNLEHLNKTIEKNKNVVAYALEWDSAIYHGVDHESLDQMWKERENGKDFSKIEELKNSFYSHYDVFQIIEFKNEDGNHATFIHPEISYLNIKDLSNKLLLQGKSQRAFPYEMVQPEKIPLLIGNYPKEDHEVIIGNDFAEDIMAVLEYENKEQLIGTKLDFYTGGDYHDDLIKNLPDSWGNKDLHLHVTVSGITSYENVFENRMYFKRNALQSTIADIYHYDVNEVKLHAEKFLVDPSKDTQSIMEKLNENSPLVKDSYHIFNGEDNVYIEWSGKINQDQKMMKQIIAVLLIITIIFLMLHRFFFKKQLKKESHILKQCGYSPIKVEAIVNLCLCIITGLLSFVLMMGCIPLLNKAALSILNRSVLDWSFIHFVYSFLFVVVIYEIGTTLYLKYFIK